MMGIHEFVSSGIQGWGKFFIENYHIMFFLVMAFLQEFLFK